MTDQRPTRARRPPPPPPPLPKFQPRQPQAQAAPARTAPLVPPQAQREWQPPARPRLVDEIPRGLDGLPLPDRRPQQEVRRNLGWIGTLGWAFGVVVLLLVVAPTDAIPKLFGPSKQPVSAAAYGPVIAMFAVGAVVVAVCGCLWLWAAMRREADNDETPPLVP